MSDKKSKFLTNLVTSQVHDRAFHWRVEAPLIYDSALVGPIYVPVGFEYDKNSVPWYLRWLFPVSGRRSDYAATLHDWVYATELYPIEVCDEIFYEAMLASNVSAFRAKAKWLAVRQFGLKVWLTHTRPGLKAKRDLLDIEVVKKDLQRVGFTGMEYHLWNLSAPPKYTA